MRLALLFIAASCSTSQAGDVPSASPTTQAVSVPTAPEVSASATYVSSPPTSTAVVTTLVASTWSASAPASSLPEQRTVDRPLSWASVGTFVEGDREIEVSTFRVIPGELCVGARAGGVALADACGVADSWWVTLVGADLYVTGTRVHEGDVVVHTTGGDHTVPAFLSEGVYAFVARVPGDEDVVGVDDGARTPGCPYRQVADALSHSQAIAVPRLPVRITACASDSARLSLGGSSVSLQGAGAILKRVGDTFTLLSVGSDICGPADTTVNPQQAEQPADTAAACASVG